LIIFCDLCYGIGTGLNIESVLAGKLPYLAMEQNTINDQVGRVDS